MDPARFLTALEGARRGDQESFAVLWRQFDPALRRVATGLAGRGESEDLAATVWVEVVRSLDVFVGDEDQFRAWLYTIARRRLIDLRRRQARRPEVPLVADDDRPGTAPDPAAVAEATVGTDAALALIGSLPPDQAEVVLLRVVADLDVATVASIVGKRPGAVRVLAHRGLRRLATLVDADAARRPGDGVTK